RCRAIAVAVAPTCRRAASSSIVSTSRSVCGDPLGTRGTMPRSSRIPRRRLTVAGMNLSGVSLLVRGLVDAGVEEVFTLHGGHLDAFYAACVDSGLRLTDTRHEASAGHAAEAYARLSGRAGVCVV